MAENTNIVDAWGRPINARPDDRLLVRQEPERVRDRAAIGSILSNVTPERLVGIFQEADAGYICRQVELAEDIEERDAHVAATLQARRTAALSVGWEVQPGGEDASAKTAAEEFREIWKTLDTRSLLERMQDAILPQWHVERVWWRTESKRWRPAACEDVDTRKLTWPMVAPETPGDITAIVPGLVRDLGAMSSELLPLNAGEFICHSYRARRGRPGKMALVRAIAFLWAIKRFAWVDFATLLEQYGRPWRGIKYDPSANQQQIRELLDILREAAADLAIAIPKGSELEFFQGMTSVGHNPHTDMIKIVDEAISKLLVGSTTVVEAAQNADSVSSPTHAAVRRDIRDADCLALAASIWQGLIVPWTLWNHGPHTAVPKLQPILAEKPEPEKRGRVFATARNELGLRLKSRQVYGDLGLEMPEDTPEILEPAAPVANPFGMATEQVNRRPGDQGGSVNKIAKDQGPGTKDNNDELKRKDAKDAEANENTAGLADDALLSRWAESAAEAAAKIGAQKMDTVRAWMADQAARGRTLGQIQRRLPELLKLIESPALVELNQQATLAALLRGMVTTEADRQRATAVTEN